MILYSGYRPHTVTVTVTVTVPVRVGPCSARLPDVRSARTRRRGRDRDPGRQSRPRRRDRPAAWVSHDALAVTVTARRRAGPPGCVH